MMLFLHKFHKPRKAAPVNWVPPKTVISASATATRSGRTVKRDTRRNAVAAEFSYRERHRTENMARIVLLYGTALLFGDAKFACIDQKLCRTHDADD